MYSCGDLPLVNRSDGERETDHPLMRAWMDIRACKTLSRDDIRNIVAPAYMGLIKELDDQMGRLFARMAELGRMNDTMIVFCSDHGDNMGDHWLGEKDLFYDCSARVPLIVYDPRPEADATRGDASDALIESIDLVPTFVEFFGGECKPHIMEGRSLHPLLRGQEVEWRSFCVSEYDYSTRDSRRAIGIDQNDARLAMIFDGRWKYIHVEKMRPLLFDLDSDPDELTDLGANPAYRDQLDRLKSIHYEWCRQHHNRITRSAEIVERMTDQKEPPGIFIGFQDKNELEAHGHSLPPHARG